MAMSVLPHHPDAAKVAERVLGASGVVGGYTMMEEVRERVIADDVLLLLLHGHSQTPPEHFLAALSDILDIRLHDTLFKIVPEPGTGCGWRCARRTVMSYS
jgi:hypothetical protein